MKFLIIGNSAAGTAAVESIRRYDQESSIIQLTDEAQPLYSRCLLSYYLSGSIEKEKLLYRGEKFHQENKVDIFAGHEFRVIELNPTAHYVTCKNGKRFNYDRLLVATGASAKLPPIVPKGIKGIFVLRTLSDVECIKQNLKGLKKAVVLGGGLIGMKAATALNQCGLHTSVVIGSTHVLSQMIDYNAAQIISKKLEGNQIDVFFQTNIVEIISNENQLIGLKTENNQYIECDLLIIAKGVNPNIELVRNTSIECDWGIKTNAYMQTTVEDIFAAGDVAEAYDISLEEYTVNALWTCAVQQGRIAGHNMIEKSSTYTGAIGMNSLNICDLSLISFGVTAPKDKNKYKQLVLKQFTKNIYKKIVIDHNNHIKGIILLGKIESAGVLLFLIQRKIDVTGFEHELLSDHFNFGSLLKYRGETELNRYYNSRKL